MGEFVVVTGPPGAGKTTVARVLAAGSGRALVAGDDFFNMLGDAVVAPWLPEAHEQNRVVMAAAAAAAGRLCFAYDVFYEGVVGPWFLAEFCAAARAERLHYIVLLPPEKVCRERVRERTGHGFTDDAAARQMYADFRDADIEPRHVVADAAGDSAGIAMAVAARVATGQALI